MQLAAIKLASLVIFGFGVCMYFFFNRLSKRNHEDVPLFESKTFIPGMDLVHMKGCEMSLSINSKSKQTRNNRKQEIKLLDNGF